jgi:MGT family glycosyltransferase
MKAIVYNIFGLGHINPTLPLIKNLVEVGVEVIYHSSPERRALIESTGALFRNYGRDDYKAADYNPGKNFVLQTIPATLGLLPVLLEEIERERPDFLIYDSMVPWGKALTQITGLPSYCTVTTFALSRERKHRMFSRFEVALDEVNGEALQELETKYGVKLELEDALGAYGENNIVFTSREFNPPVENEERFYFMGPSLERHEDLTGFTLPDKKKRIITMGLGTILREEDPGVLDWYRELIKAFADDPDYELILAGGDLGPLPANVRSYERIPQLFALKHSHVFINHGGMNSLNEGLHFGVPMIAIPHSKDQFVNAERLAETGKGLVLQRHQVKAHILRSCVERLIGRDA